MKGFALTATIFSVFLYFISLSSAACLPNDAIISLYDATNSHAALANDASASVKICYADIFGSAYTGTTPYQCTATNLVVNLSSSSNAHAATSNSPGYSVGVCYGDLTCRTTNLACIGNEREVLSMSSLTNAHVGVAGSYPYRVCCSQQTVVGASARIEETYWAAGQNPALQITKSDVNRTVGLVANTYLIPDGALVRFEIREDDGLFGTDAVRIGANAITGQVQGNRAVALWKIDDADIDAGKNGVGEGTILEMKFNASIGGLSNVSGILEVNMSAGVGLPPVAKICQPEHRQIYFSDTSITFEDCSVDDGEIQTSQWNIDEDAFTSTGRTFNHVFNSIGQKTITLKVTDNNGMSAEQQIAILIVAPNLKGSVLGFINSPYYKEVIYDPTRKGVKFSANDSYVVNVTLTACAATGIDCLGGNCPLISRNPPAGCTENVSVSNSPQPFSSILFNWTFDDNWNYGGMGAYEGTRSFASYSRKFDDHWIQLLVQHSGAGVAKITWRNFTYVGLSQCIIDEFGGRFIDLDPDTGLVRETRSINQGGCVGADKIASGNVGQRGDDCCPERYLCVSDGVVPAHCVLNSTAPIACGDYKDRTSCQSDAYNVAEYEFNPERSANPACDSVDARGAYWECSSCVWRNKSGESTPSCWLNKTSRVLPGVTSCSQGACYTRTLDDSLVCGEDGYFTLNDETDFVSTVDMCPGITAESIGCVSGNYRVPCRGSLELPFVSLFGIVASLLVIIGIYALQRRKR